MKTIRLFTLLSILTATVIFPSCHDTGRTAVEASKALDKRDYTEALKTILSEKDSDILDSKALMQMLSTAYYGLTMDVTDDIGSNCNDFIFTPDGNSVIFNDAETGIMKIHSYPDMQTQRSVQLPYPAYSIALSPDGKRLAAAAVMGNIYIVDMESGEITDRLAGHTADVRDVAFCDPTTLITCSNDRNVTEWDLNGLTPVWRRHHHAKNIKSLQLSRDSTLAVTASNDGASVLFKTAKSENGKELHRFIHGKDYVNDAGISPDNSFAVTVSGDGSVKTWGVEKGERRQEKNLGDQLGTVDISPDGKMILVAGTRNVYILDSDDLSVIIRIQTSNMPVWSAQFTDNSRIAFADNTRFYQADVLTGRDLVEAARQLSVKD